MATAAEASGKADSRTADKKMRDALKEKTVKGRVKDMDLSPEELSDKMSQVTPAMIIRFREKVIALSTAMITAATYSIFEFLGFDPRKIWEKLIAIAVYYDMTYDELLQDILFMIAANIYMGNLSGKTLDRRSEQGKNKIASLVSAYSIKIGSTGSGQPPDVITFPRVSAAFPVLSTRMAFILKPKDLIGMPFMTLTLPYFMRIGPFASFLDSSIEDKTRDFLLKAVSAYTCDQSIIFSTDRKTRKPTLDALSAHGLQWNFITVASNSPVPVLWEKGAMLEEFKIITLYERLLPIVLNYKKLVGEDPSVVSKTDYENAIKKFLDECKGERTRKDAEDKMIVAESRASSRAQRAAPAGQQGPPPTTPSTQGAAPFQTEFPPPPSGPSGQFSMPGAPPPPAGRSRTFRTEGPAVQFAAGLGRGRARGPPTDLMSFGFGEDTATHTTDMGSTIPEDDGMWEDTSADQGTYD